MTVLIGIHLGSAVLLAADTRQSWGEGGNRGFREGSRKVVDIGIGIATGAGLSEFIDGVTSRLGEIEHTAHVIDVIEEEWATLAQRLPPVQIERWRTSTGWMFSYVGLDDDHMQHLRLGFIHGSHLDNLKRDGVALELIQPLCGIVVPPIEGDEEWFREYNSMLGERIRDASEFDGPEEFLRWHVSVCKEMIRAIGERVGPKGSVGIGMTFGLHLPGATPFVSDIVPVIDLPGF